MLNYLTDRSFEDTVSFMEEWQFTKNYMDFLKINYHDRLIYEMEAEGDFERIIIPPLVIQPLAENAVKHGIRIDRKGEMITITARADKDSLRIQVRDNGRGLQTDSPYSRTLGHIRDRLKHHHRDSELLVENNDDGGVTATISIPLEGWARDE
jgi:sensor histidine kinase YesM